MKRLYRTTIRIPGGVIIAVEDGKLFEGWFELTKEECNCRELGRGYCMCDGIDAPKQKPSEYIAKKARLFKSDRDISGVMAMQKATLIFLDEHFSK